jgi:acyl carrier protein
MPQVAEADAQGVHIVSSPHSLVRRELLPLPGPYVEPRTITEQRLADIWSSVLSMDRVGVEDGYHDLGGDSFLAQIIVAKIRETFGIRAPMAVLIRTPTISRLAVELDRLCEVDRSRTDGGGR